MARIAGVDIPQEKRIEISLTYIFGIGPSLSKKILLEANVSVDKRVKELQDDELARIRQKIVELQIPVEGNLKRMVTQNVKRLIDIKSYRGQRHRAGLPTRGQRTRSNARTRKGKRKTVGGMKKKLAKK